MNPETEAIDIPGDDAINAFVRPNWERKQAEKEAAGKGTAEPYKPPPHRTCAKFFTAPKGNARLYITAKGLYIKEYPRLFFTTDVLGPMCTDKPELPPERYCALLEKQEDLLWNQIFVRSYIYYLFEPNKPKYLRLLLDIPPAHPLQDSSVAAYQHVTAAAVSYQRRQYTALLKKILEQMQK